MTAAVAASPASTERGSLNIEGTYRPSKQADHSGHGCCNDVGRFMRRGVFLGNEPGTSLVGIETLVPTDRQSKAMAIALRCRSWRCSCCAGRLRRRARARALMGASGSKVAMLTLTIDTKDPRFANPANRLGKARPLDPREPTAAIASESVRYAAWAWNRFTTYMQREYGHVPYFKGMELQRSGVAHLHVIVRLRDSVEFMALRNLVRGPEDDRGSGLAVRAGFGRIVDMQLARSSGDVANYVTKAAYGAADGREAAAYATKGLKGGMPRYTRRSSWSTSDAAAWAPGWVKPLPLTGFTWRIARASTATVTDALLRSEFVVIDPANVRAGSHPAMPGEGVPT